MMERLVSFQMHNNNHSLKTNYYRGCRCDKCLKHNSEYQKEWRSRGKFEARRVKLRELRDRAKDVPCADCGNKYPPVCMDFDHLEDKTFSIGGSSRSEESLLEEIAKCDVVCANCHRLRTQTRKQYGRSL